MNKTRIAFVTPFFNPVLGGVEEVVKRAAEYLVLRGYDVHVVTYNRLRLGGAGSLPKEEAINGVHVIRLKPKFLWGHGTYSNELPAALKDIKPDIVHVHVWRHPHVFTVAKLKERLGFKAVLHCHGPFQRFSQLGPIVWLYHEAVDAFRKQTPNKYDKIIALTPYGRDVYVNNFGIQKEKLVIIPNGIPDEIFNHKIDSALRRSNPYLLYISRMSRERNVDLAIKALKYVSAPIDVKLLLAGPDEGSLKKIRALSQKIGVANRVYYKGPVRDSARFDLYMLSAIYVDPCLYEAFGLSLLEAQAFGKPCIVTGFGGQLYTAPPGKVSIYAEPNPRDFAKGISKLLQDEELYHKMSLNAVEWARKHTWSKIIGLYENLYNSL